MADIVLIGEAWGEEEERQGRAFVGSSGYLLDRMLQQAGISRKDCFATNVFNFRPPANKIAWVCGDKDDGVYGYPALIKGGYVRREFQSELDRLGDELEKHNPNIVICLGNTACWALLGKTMISKLRGTVQYSTHTYSGLKVLPTYHPAAVSRQWSLRPTVVIDLIKGQRESEYADIIRPVREIWIEPTLEDILEYDRLYIEPCEELAVDIETAGSIITLIGFAPNESTAIVIPGLGVRRAGRDYWPDRPTQYKVYRAIRTILKRPTPKVFQNGLYDAAFIIRAWAMAIGGLGDDTMLLHHALQPESLKSLGFLGSIYTDEGPWKQMREVKTIKRED